MSHWKYYLLKSQKYCLFKAQLIFFFILISIYFALNQRSHKYCFMNKSTCSRFWCAGIIYKYPSSSSGIVFAIPLSPYNHQNYTNNSLRYYCNHPKSSYNIFISPTKFNSFCKTVYKSFIYKFPGKKSSSHIILA